MKLLKTVVIIGLIFARVTKTDGTPPYILRDLEGKGISITETKLGKSIADFFKNNVVSWENSVLKAHIDGWTAFGNNIVRIAKKNIGILNYWDVKKELDYYKKEYVPTVEKIAKDIANIGKEILEETEKMTSSTQKVLSNVQAGLSDIQKQLEPKFVKNLWEYVKKDPKGTAFITAGIIGGGLLFTWVMKYFFSLLRARNELERIKESKKIKEADEFGTIEVVVFI